VTAARAPGAGASWRRRALCAHRSRAPSASLRDRCATLDLRASAAPRGCGAGRPGPARGARGAARRQFGGFDQQIGAFPDARRRVSLPIADHGLSGGDEGPCRAPRSPIRCAHCRPDRCGCTGSAIIGRPARCDRRFDAFPCRFRPFSRRTLDHGSQTASGCAARPSGQAWPARVSARRGGRGSRVKGRVAIASATP
jgi:hypothetical protein